MEMRYFVDYKLHKDLLNHWHRVEKHLAEEV